MKDEVTTIDLQSWSLQEQLTYGLCWCILLALIAVLFWKAK